MDKSRKINYMLLENCKIFYILLPSSIELKFLIFPTKDTIIFEATNNLEMCKLCIEAQIIVSICDYK